MVSATGIEPVSSVLQTDVSTSLTTHSLFGRPTQNRTEAKRSSGACSTIKLWDSGLKQIEHLSFTP